MVLPTFQRLSAEKQARVHQALLHEFSQHPLAAAQVARIVKDADIARGAFYKYFSDLNDAYDYVLSAAMSEIHRAMPATPTAANTAAYLDSIQKFIAEADKAGYRQLIEQHYRYNEGYLGSAPTRLLEGASGAKQWAITVLYHQTIRDIVLDPASAAQRLEQLRRVLQQS